MIFCKAGSEVRLAIQVPLRAVCEPMLVSTVGTMRPETVDTPSDVPNKDPAPEEEEDKLDEAKEGRSRE
jgi:hypothetical protein